MTDNEKTIALHEIGVALSDAPTTERLLVQVRVYAGHPVESGAAGLVDIAHRDLRLAMSKLRILSPEHLADVAGPEAKRAYSDFHAAYDGIEDAYVGVTAPLLGGTLQAWYHDFSTEQGSDDYGDEIDLSYAHPIPGVKGLVGLVKYATYDSDDKARTVDTDKVWLQLQYSY